MNYQKVVKEKSELERSKIMYKYAQLNRFHRDCQLQVYMYYLIYVDSRNVPVENHFIVTKIFAANYKKCQLQEHSQNISLDLVTYVQKMMSEVRTLMIQIFLKQSDRTSNNKVRMFRKKLCSLRKNGLII